MDEEFYLKAFKGQPKSIRQLFIETGIAKEVFDRDCDLIKNLVETNKLTISGSSIQKDWLDKHNNMDFCGKMWDDYKFHVNFLNNIKQKR